MENIDEASVEEIKKLFSQREQKFVEYKPGEFIITNNHDAICIKIKDGSIYITGWFDDYMQLPLGVISLHEVNLKGSI